MQNNSITSLPLALRLLRAAHFPRKLGILERIFGQDLSALGVATVTCANGHIWTLDLREVTHRWLAYGDYEGPLQMNWLRNFLKNGGVFIDSGANIGQFVASLSHLPNVRTYAFEPVAHERDWLVRCLERYPEWPVRVVPLALGPKEQRVKIRLAGGKSILRQDWYQNQELAEELISMTTLDAFAHDHGLETIRLWKLDMEGFEPQALAGAQRLLAERRIDALLIEAQGSTIPAIKEGLAIGNYQLFCIHSSGRLVPASDCTQGRPFAGNLLAVPILSGPA